MYFTLEALQAHHGDSLLLHWGPKSNPKLAVIDGGPDPTYRTVLRPRLEALTAARDQPLVIELLMISHIDDDHINGVQDLLRDLDRGKLPNVAIQRLWFNSFDDLAASNSGFVAASARSSAATLTRLGRIGTRSRPVVASVKQGRSVATLAARLGLAGNPPLRGLIQAPARGSRTVKIDSHLELTIIGPNRTRLDQLQEDWVAIATGARPSPAALAYLDDSIANLSSIVVLVRSGTKTMLLTGDARGDDTLAGLRSAGLLKTRMKVHVFKLPHHGSDRNVDTDLFRAVHADHYVISGDGSEDNPELATLAMITDARRGDAFALHFTNREPRVKRWLERNRTSDDRYVVSYRRANSPSISVDLRDPVEF